LMCFLFACWVYLAFFAVPSMVKDEIEQSRAR